MSKEKRGYNTSPALFPFSRLLSPPLSCVGSKEEEEEERERALLKIY